MAEAVTKLSIALVGWQIIPAVASNIFARIWMSITGKQLTARDKHYIILSGLFAYLLVNFITAITGVEASFYELLNVPPDADENTIRLAFRSFARKNHPDRVGAGGADMFMAVRHGYESLMDPNKRWAYDRFGTGIMRCTTCQTQLDFLHEGLISSAGFHLTTLSVILGSTLLGGRSWVTLWRLLLSLFTLFAELVLIFHPSPGQATIYDRPPLILKLLGVLLPNRVPFQCIHFMHHLTLFLNLAMSRVLVALFPSSPGDTNGSLSQRAVQDLAIRIHKLERQTTQHIHDELSAVLPPDMEPAQRQASFAQLTRGMERLVLEKRLTTGEDSPIGSHVPRSPPRPGPSRPGPSRTTSFAAPKGKNPALVRQVSALRVASSSARPMPQRRTSMATGAQVGAPSTPGSRPSRRRQLSGITRGEAIEVDGTDTSESSFRWSDSGIGDDTVAGGSFVVVDEPDASRALRSDLRDEDVRHELMLLPTERSGRDETPDMPGEYRRGRSKSW